VLHSFYMDKKAFIGGDHPSIADIRLASTLEFLRVIDYHFPVYGSASPSTGRLTPPSIVSPGRTLSAIDSPRNFLDEAADERLATTEPECPTNPIPPTTSGRSARGSTRFPAS
jgi:glutathione S-transferase